VCRSESIADSNATLAADLRREVEAQIRAGRTDQQIYDFMTARYGDFVLMEPPVAPRTWLLWAGPALFLVAGLAVVLIVVRRRSRIAATNPAALEEEPDRP
jgi:cytochrome c-type biogenesis protein CcmH